MHFKLCISCTVGRGGNPGQRLFYRDPASLSYRLYIMSCSRYRAALVRLSTNNIPLVVAYVGGSCNGCNRGLMLHLTFLASFIAQVS